LVVCLQAMWACGARTPAVVSTPAQTDQPTSPPSTAATSPGPAPAPVIDPPPHAPVDECALIAGAGEPIATVGLTDRIDPSNALHPSNASERLLFGQLYETLVGVDCMGRVRPGLASSWRADERGVHVWFVTLRQDARFSDGTPVTAADVRASWMSDGGGGEVRPNIRRLVTWVDVVDDRTLVIQLATPRVDAPVTLAHPHLAVAKRVADSPLLLGTRSSRLETGIDATGRIASFELTVSRNHLPPLRFLVAPGDPRDLLDAGVDLLLTRDPATLDYAATLPHFQREPLAWHRTYLFVSAGLPALARSLSEDERQALADDAVRGEARGAQGPFWWESDRCHLTPLAGQRPHVPNPRIVYDATDGVARDLAERFVALAGASSPAATPFLDVLLPDRPRRTFERATGLTGAALTDARREGLDAGYIVSVGSRPLDHCNDKYALFESVQWARTAVPLVDTRLQAVVRRGRSGLTTDFDGSMLIDGMNDPRSR
jgi:hypothetical protein